MSVIKTKEDLASGMNHSSVTPDPEEDLIMQAYQEMLESLNERVEGTYEDTKQLDVQTSKNTPSIKIQVLGYTTSPHAKAAKAQEDAVSGALPPTDKHVEDAEAPTGYEQIIWDYVSDMEADIERGEMDQQEVVDHVTAEFEQYHLNGPADVRDGAKIEAAVERMFSQLGLPHHPVYTSRIATGEMNPGAGSYMQHSSANPRKFG